MEVCYLSYPLDLSEYYFSSVVSIGYFDGVHVGHQQLIQTGIRIAKKKKLTNAVMTFHPHPKEVLGKGDYSRYLTPLEDKLEMFKSMGVDTTYIVQFSPTLSKVQPQDFIELFILPLNIKHIVVGFDYRFGSKGTGTPEYLKHKSEGRYQVDIIEPVKRYNAKVGSTFIRHYVEQGSMSLVNELLGRPYHIEATFIDLGKNDQITEFTVSNICIQKPYVIPNNGVFRVKVYIGEGSYEGLLMIDFTRTVKVEAEKILLYISKFNQLDIKDRNIGIEILASTREYQDYIKEKKASEFQLMSY